MTRLLLAIGALTAHTHGAPSWDAALHLHDPSTIERFDARCLDGTAPGFYYRPASSSAASSKWKVHFQGGGWCTSPADCLSRSKGQLGSSSAWSPWLSSDLSPHAAFYGLMSANSTDVNIIGDYHMVWFAYCDGSSQTSDRATPLIVDGTPIHLRGRAILDAHFFELERLYSFLTTATEVVISGTSAGGLSTYLHSSFIKSQLRVPSARLVAVPDAGWWWEHLAYNSTTASPWVDSFTPAITASLWNSTLRGSGARCLSEHPSDAVKCYTQPYAYSYMDVPTFVIQSQVDTANLGYCYRMPCHLNGNTGTGTCSPEEVVAINAFGGEMVASIKAAQAPFGARDGHFITSCNQHEESCTAADFFGVTIGDSTMHDAFRAWYTGAQDASRVDAAWPSDSTCVDDITHGFC